MTISFSGYSGGPMTELQWALTAHVSSRFESAADCAPSQPNTTLRSVSVAAGSATAFGVRVTTDAAISQTLTAPGTGGAWYLLTWRRTWSPTKTVVLQVLGGPTTAGTTAPTVAPTVAPSGFVNTPGVQHDQPIAWVWVSSASTTLAIFDVRLIATLTGVPQAPTLDALAFAAAQLRDGALVGTPELAVNGGTLRAAVWRLGGGVLQPVGGLRVSAAAARPTAEYWVTTYSTVTAGGVGIIAEDTQTEKRSFGGFLTAPPRLTGTTSQRTAAGTVPDRTRFFDTDVNAEMEYKSGAWAMANGFDILTTAQRTAATVPQGWTVFDLTLNLLVWADVTNGQWRPVLMRALLTNAQRVATTTSGANLTVPDGFEVVERDTGNTYRWYGVDGWVLWDMPRTAWQAFGYASGFSNASGGNTRSLSWLVRQGHLAIAGIAFGTFASGTYSTVTAVTAGTKPPGAYLPNGTTNLNARWAAHGAGGKPCAGQMGSDGNVTLVWNNFGGTATAPTWIDTTVSIPYGVNA